MTAISMIPGATTNTGPPEIRNGVQFLESYAIVNGGLSSSATAVAAGFTVGGVKTRGLSVPPWATKAVFTLFVDAQAGTTPGVTFKLGIPDWGSLTLLSAPTDATDLATFGNAAWDGTTSYTAETPAQIVIEVGPDVTDDDTGSATASCYYGVKGELPPVLFYTLTILINDADEDYTHRLAVMWR